MPYLDVRSPSLEFTLCVTSCTYLIKQARMCSMTKNCKIRNKCTVRTVDVIFRGKGVFYDFSLVRHSFSHMVEHPTSCILQTMFTPEPVRLQRGRLLVWNKKVQSPYSIFGSCCSCNLVVHKVLSCN